MTYSSDTVGQIDRHPAC